MFKEENGKRESCSGSEDRLTLVEIKGVAVGTIYMGQNTLQIDKGTTT